MSQGTLKLSESSNVSHSNTLENIVHSSAAWSTVLCMVSFDTWKLAIPCGVAATKCSICYQGQRWSNKALNRSFFAHWEKGRRGRVSPSVIMYRTVCTKQAFDSIWIAFFPPTGTFLCYVQRGLTSSSESLSISSLSEEELCFKSKTTQTWL